MPLVRLALRNLWSRRLRSALALTGLTIAIVLVVGLMSMSAGIRLLVGDALSMLDGILVLQEGNPDAAFSVLEEDLAEDIRAIPGVRAVVPQVVTVAIKVNDNETWRQDITSVPILTGQPATELAKARGGGLMERNLVEGRGLRPGDADGIEVTGPDGEAVTAIPVVLSRKHSEQFDAPVGSVIRINAAGRVMTGGVARDFTVVGLYATGNPVLDNQMAAPYDVVHEIKGFEDGLCSVFYVEPEDLDDDAVNAMARRIEDTLAADDGRAPVSCKTSDDLAGDSQMILGKLDTFLGVLAGITVVIAAVGILNTMVMSLQERVREFGVLKAVGWSKGDVLRLVVTESLALGVAGGLVGVGVGWGAVEIIGSLLSIRPVTTPQVMLLGLAMAVALGVIGGAYPAWRASRLEPISAIRRD